LSAIRDRSIFRSLAENRSVPDLHVKKNIWRISIFYCKNNGNATSLQLPEHPDRPDTEGIAMSKSIVTRPQDAVAVDATDILADLRELIHSARCRVATVANAEQTLLYWRLGKRIRTEVLGGDRAIYGGQIVVSVSREYLTELPPIELLRSRLHLAIELAREQAAQREVSP
jgi:hypothetical protein